MIARHEHGGLRLAASTTTTPPAREEISHRPLSDRACPRCGSASIAPKTGSKDGRPGTRQSAPASLEHIDVKADLTKHGRTGDVGESQQRTLDGEYVVTATFTGLAPSTARCELELAPTARET